MYLSCFQFETLGDAVYMAVSGAPLRKLRHAEPMAAMALAMMESMSMFLKDCTMDTLTLTIGNRLIYLVVTVNPKNNRPFHGYGGHFEK
jgi:hypothetical protein